MKTYNLFGVLFLSLCLFSLAGCVKEEWDSKEKKTKYSTVVEGTILSSNSMPLAGISVKVDYHESMGFHYSKTRHKAEAKTDKSGKYRLYFTIKDDEIETDKNKENGFFKSYSLIFDLKNLNPKEYILPGDMYPTVISVDPPIAKPTENTQPEIRYGYSFERSKIYVENLYIPQKRYIQVTLKKFVPRKDLLHDSFEISTAFPYGGESATENLFPGTKYGYRSVDNFFVLYAGEEQTFEVPFALNENNIIRLNRRKNGDYSTEEHQVFVTEDSPKNLTYDY